MCRITLFILESRAYMHVASIFGQDLFFFLGNKIANLYCLARIRPSFH